MSSEMPPTDDTQTSDSSMIDRPEVAGPANDHGTEGTGAQIGRLIVSIGSPLALLTALLFYFGWVRTQVQARELGYDAAILDLSTTDYLLKSVNVLFPVVAAVLLIATAAHALYDRLFPGIAASPTGRRWLGRLGSGLQWLTVISIALGIGLFLLPATRFAAVPIGLTAAVLFALAGRNLRRRLTGKDPWSKPGHILASLLLALLLFWDTERVARAFGEQYAADIAADPTQLAAIVIYSHDDLHIEAEGVSRDTLGDGSDAYRFRYRGLRLMARASDRYVLINEAWWDGKGRVIVLKDANTIRVEFID